MDSADEESYKAFASTNALSLRRCAYLFCGDWHLAEDLMQAALIKIYRAWPKMKHRHAVGAYARTVLLRTWMDERRRPWRRSETQHADVPDIEQVGADPADAAGRAWTRDTVHRALLILPARQRAALVLRYFEELSVAETAEVMRCSEGNVKSQTARGLASLRKAVGAIAPRSGPNSLGTVTL
ncbi:RNA polymerase sigma-70 factor (sigma-E family) [Herbihabitans rhizosphaerae]|uniref:RNA polymerase sigma-70 factor (Sigma-E family) n=1 Tax=Herbihabitans rhizosphaerae TaxID=1872711 RepID=A0A4Q7KWF2_9PSEU|nr:SigE family RNA polymerase sigma factor [Herbihabitans rhizosphaerae]RZS41398.1 RNA polymerase sigma-70 factor (sigma-E family) [Herbihabitans rhizosphaerae]